MKSTGSKWQSHRKLLTPAFHFKILENFLPTIINQQNIMQSLIDKQIEDNDGVVDDMRNLITNYTLDAICETAMGVTVRAQQNPNSDYVEAIRRTFAVSILRFIKPWLWPDFTFYLSSLGRLLQRRLRILHGFTDSVIKERKTEILDKIKDLNNNDVNNNYKNGKSIGDAIDEAMTRIGAKRQLVFLDTLLNYHFKRPNHMSELDVRSHVDTFMFGGHDTTASSLMFTIMLVGQHPDVQVCRIHEELDNIFSDDTTREMTVDDLRRLKYLDQCVRESLRLFPPIQIIGRQIEAPFTLKNGYHIPRGTTCYIPLICLHRDPHHFPDPDAFDPDRFGSTPGGVAADRHPYAYVPFSAGPRNCIGQ
ncbi:unnamed protein product, partial [Medioppia subpectinata]